MPTTQSSTHRFAHPNFVNVETFTTYRPPIHSTPFRKPEWVDLSKTIWNHFWDKVGAKGMGVFC
ncbi:uncharacterized protein BDZ99DRAFT_172105 [Mytilinidion resinicola]|uniref:Uncharacterized protein n=1 Tax=Mytilinidion resinicola TaxID=574789 RepID=A0A6A6Y3P5_9PEZI|nr:uncharacterized protein BDZ99DRAFT_172105 [Mytilinidion resinicola]KAF2803402.1 hypothetical protein BDZ99DRAFT_172105 [Mytilinidion resinicola]